MVKNDRGVDKNRRPLDVGGSKSKDQSHDPLQAPKAASLSRFVVLFLEDVWLGCCFPTGAAFELISIDPTAMISI